MNQAVEFRYRGTRHPTGQPLRIFLGRATSRAELRGLRELRDLFKRLAERGEWDTLDAVKARRVTPAQVSRSIDHYGIRDYRRHLDVEPEALVPRLDEHMIHFLDTIEKPHTFRVYRSATMVLRNHTVDGQRLGERPWHRVLSHHIRDLVVQERKAKKPATVKLYTAAWSAFYTWALRREVSLAREERRKPVAQVNPVREAEVWITVKPTRHRFFTAEEYFRWIESSPPRMRAVYATLTLTGLRISEVCALPAAHVSPDSHIHVGPWGDWGPKTERSVRDIPVHPTQLRPLLEEHAREWGGDGYFFLNPQTGEGWRHDALRRRFARDIEGAGLPYGVNAGPEGITPHTCRHTFASWLAQADVQLIKIATLMGDTVDVVVKHYAHLLPSDLDESVRRLFSGPVSHAEATA